MIDTVYNMFDEDFMKFLKSKISDKKFSEPSRNSTSRNYYNRLEFELDEKTKEKLESLLFSKYNKKYELKKGGVWINKVNTESNQDDDFHFDNSDLSIVTYLNNDFGGGQFEYINSENENIKIEPRQGLSIFIQSKTLHRVLPVSFGTRYSCVFFFDYLIKNKQTLL